MSMSDSSSSNCSAISEPHRNNPSPSDSESTSSADPETNRPILDLSPQTQPSPRILWPGPILTSFIPRPQTLPLRLQTSPLRQGYSPDFYPVSSSSSSSSSPSGLSVLSTIPENAALPLWAPPPYTHVETTVQILGEEGMGEVSVGIRDNERDSNRENDQMSWKEKIGWGLKWMLVGLLWSAAVVAVFVTVVFTVYAVRSWMC